MSIRKATIQDVGTIHEMLNYYAGRDLLLPRPLSELYDHLRDYFVIENSGVDHRQARVLGVCALGICWEDLAEIRSLAVDKDQQGKGLGSQLVKACLDEAHVLGLRRVFVLTYVPAFFRGLGFQETEKSSLPHKIWADCLRCPKFPDCDETALMIDL
ncbi:MAG: N-acetyltransferase [Desulfatiglans sp.]|nr:N-acetyltransferase [Desulfatiglans sp.]